MKIIVYDDNPDFGGHQVMAALGVEALAADPSIELVFLVHPENRRLIDRLAEIGTCEVLESPCTTRRPQGIRNRMDRRGIHRLKGLFQALQADLLLCIQGDIEQSSQALMAAHATGLECVSYIALPHSMSAMGAKMGRLRDRCDQSLIHLPKRFITISERMAALLRERGAMQRIDVVRNGIPLPSPSETAAHTPRSARFTLGMLGRLEFRQKRQDFVVRTFSSHPQEFADCRLVIAGDGPDRKKLERMIAACSGSAITLTDWQSDPDAFLAIIDLLVIPSRYEGVPLAMLEALARGIPVIGSNRDGMADYLPAAWTFDPDDAEALARTFSRVRNCRPEEIGPVQQRVISDCSIEAFRKGFVAAVLS